MTTNRKYEFSIGEKVRVKVGAFQCFTGQIVAIDTKNELLTVRVHIFRRPETIELKFPDVEKLKWN